MAVVEFDRNDLRILKHALHGIKNGAPTVMRRALNKTIVSARTQAVKFVRAEVNLKAKTVTGQMKVTKANFRRLSASLNVKGSPIPLTEYDARESNKGKGTTFRVRKKGARERYPHAFIATMKSGHRGVFERRKFGLKRVGRLQIDERFGPSVPAVFARNGLKKVQSDGANNLQKNLVHETEWLLKKYE